MVRTVIDEDYADEPRRGGDDSDDAASGVFAHDLPRRSGRNGSGNGATRDFRDSVTVGASSTDFFSRGVTRNTAGPTRNGPDAVRNAAGSAADADVTRNTSGGSVPADPFEVPAWQRVVPPASPSASAPEPPPTPEARVQAERPTPEARVRAERPTSQPASERRVIRAEDPDRPPPSRTPARTRRASPTPEYEALAEALAGPARDANDETQLIPKIEDQGPIPIRGGKSSRRAAARARRKLNRKLRVISGFGEVLISIGGVVALYVVYTLWWTNVTAHAAAKAETSTIQHQFQQQATNPSAPPPKTVFDPSEGFGLMSIPGMKLKDIPVLQGTDKASVLDKGAIGHYTDPKTAMPWDKTGNFAVAAHRATHGEPFRYLNTLKVGDHVILETTHGWYIYQLDKELAQTDPSNVGVIAPIPQGGPYTKAGQYITLTTCTPEWASTWRMIWWGHLVRVDPLNGPPPAELSAAR